MKRPRRSTRQLLAAASSPASRLCAASRPVSSLPDSSSVCPGFQLAHFSVRQRVEVHAPAGRGGFQCTSGQQVERGRIERDRPAAVEHEVRVPRRRAVGIIATGFDAACVGNVADLDVEHGRQAAEALGADAERVDLLVELDAQLLELRLRPARQQLVHVDRIHQRFLREHHRLLGACRRRRCRACPAGTSRRPSSGTVSSTQSTMLVDGFSIANFDLFSEPPPLAATVTSTLSPGDQLDVHHGRRVVAGVLALANRGPRRSRRAARCPTRP